jgi:adenosylcobinamide kinase/adenosylcobinamide-phosphate guanylyltransferase
MKLVIGGAYQGKKAWVMQQYGITEDAVIDGAADETVCIKKAKVLNGLHLLVRNWLSNGKEPVQEMTGLLAANPDIIIITDEIGNGIIPVDRDERAYREVHGRLCCQLAGSAEEVYRVLCGIGQKIK